ncbi:granule-bound starch synthase 1, chloroplastic amyloplastic [Olea europaea subsp. europaea]|uniref:Starch synthase, chloroplastic/amyloplastic n=1 Tax=Olea europaea subsp. europaea TaxID=158383 RepID=A0A8S0SKW7_OLEEU|nr:granule-bound starch synthase 1, chloroplastic amyloplastic [Olea europaea subsp. europaea]
MLTGILLWHLSFQICEKKNHMTVKGLSRFLYRYGKGMWRKTICCKSRSCLFEQFSVGTPSKYSQPGFMYISFHHQANKSRFFVSIFFIFGIKIFISVPIYYSFLCLLMHLNWISRVLGPDHFYSFRFQAALMAPRVLNLTGSKYFSGPYGEDVIFIANDWHTALLPCYLKTMYQSRGIYMNAKVAFCIHNIAYQGRFAFSDFSLLGLPDSYKNSFEFIDGYEKPVKGRKINWMKAGILESDRVFTVSPYYAQELVSGVEKGVELDNIIRRTGITGIINGMDTQEWNPSTDKYIDVHYDITTVMNAKSLLKEALQAAVGLPVDKNIPVIGFIGRLEEQKGSDILTAAIPKFIGMNVQIIILGTGKKRFEQQIKQLEVLYPDKARGVAKFNVPLAHMIIAGADFMLIPSRFEPCGLIQLHAMRYGTIPICASTGGLVDTVKEGFTGIQMGDFNVECSKVDPADVLKIVAAVGRALAVYGTLAFREMIKNCMSQDLSWKGPAKNWELMLLSLGAVNSEPGIEGEEIAPLSKENVATP